MNAEFPSGAQRVRGALCLPEGAGPHPGVVVIPDVWGLAPHYEQIAQKLAGGGYAEEVVVPAGSEFKTLADVIAKAKAAPGTVTFGSAGPGSTHHLGIELLAGRTGAKFNHIPYRGDAPIVTALLANQVQFSLATPTQTLANVQGGKLRAIAVAGNTRHAALPDVPTVEQALGIQNYDVRTWFAIAAPAGLPKPVLDRLNAEVRKAVAAPEVRTRLAAMGGEPLYVLATDAAANRVVVGRREELATRTVALRDAVLRRDGARVNQVKLRYRSRPISCRVEAGAGHHPKLSLKLDQPAYGVAPGQTASLMEGERIVGHATIAS